MTSWACRFSGIYLMMVGLACANPLEFEVTSSGTGVTKSQALSAARENALVDVFKVVSAGDTSQGDGTRPCHCEFQGGIDPTHHAGKR